MVKSQEPDMVRNCADNKEGWFYLLGREFPWHRAPVKHFWMKFSIPLLVPYAFKNGNISFRVSPALYPGLYFIHQNIIIFTNNWKNFHHRL